MDQNKSFDTGKIDKYGRASGNMTYPKNPTWCPGCGNYAIWGAIRKGLELSLAPKEKIVMVYDIGCSGNMADFNKSYAIHALHGRALPTAVGIKMANPDLTVVAIAGDGGSFGEGGGHFLNEMRGNHDITYLVHDNHRYSLTIGQTSPTTIKGDKTKSTPYGAIEEALNPVAIALANHASFVAREFSSDIPRLAGRIAEAIKHPGFSFIDILQPCPVFNPMQSYEWYRERLVPIAQDHDTSDKIKGFSLAMMEDKLPVGVFYKDDKPSYTQQMGVKIDSIGKDFNRDITEIYNKYL